jgi:hypothetical protein
VVRLHLICIIDALGSGAPSCFFMNTWALLIVPIFQVFRGAAQLVHNATNKVVVLGSSAAPTFISLAVFKHFRYLLPQNLSLLLIGREYVTT